MTLDDFVVAFIVAIVALNVLSGAVGIGFGLYLAKRRRRRESP